MMRSTSETKVLQSRSERLQHLSVKHSNCFRRQTFKVPNSEFGLASTLERPSETGVEQNICYLVFSGSGFDWRSNWEWLRGRGRNKCGMHLQPDARYATSVDRSQWKRNQNRYVYRCYLFTLNLKQRSGLDACIISADSTGGVLSPMAMPGPTQGDWKHLPRSVLDCLDDSV